MLIWATRVIDKKPSENQLMDLKDSAFAHQNHKFYLLFAFQLQSLLTSLHLIQITIFFLSQITLFQDNKCVPYAHQMLNGKI